MSKEQEVGRLGLTADRVTDATHGAPTGLRPDGSVPTDAGHSPLPWTIHAERIDSRAAALEELTYQLDHTKELASHLYLLNADGLCPALTGCGPASKANAEFIVRACNSHYELLEALEEFSREYDGMEDGTGDTCPTLIKARAAIAKARGAA